MTEVFSAWPMPEETQGDLNSLSAIAEKNTAHLDRNHTCFGKVIEGLDIIDAIQQGDRILSIEIVEK